MTGYDQRIVPVAGVVGDPVAHSLSPLIMSTWLDWHGLEGRYEAIEIRPDHFRSGIDELRSAGYRGVNVTLPHKEAAFSIADEVSEGARHIRAANLLRFEDSRLHADNTDVFGIRCALEELECDPARPVVLVGAGGAARAALHVLIEDGFSQIRILNRTRERAQALLDTMQVDGQVYDMNDPDVAVYQAGLVINATSLGMTGQPALEIDLSGLDQDAGIFDMVYTPLKTDLLLSAEARNHRTVEGLTMLIAQARPSFQAFFGLEAPSEEACPLRKKLVDRLEQRS